MSAVETIKRVLDTRLLSRELTVLPSRGATEIEIKEEQEILGRSLCSDHVAILYEWNGIVLDIIRLFGCGGSTKDIGRLSELQVPIDFGVSGALVIGSDASGFVYVQADDRRVFSFDTDGGDFKLLATDLDDFFDRLVFGVDAALFAGDDWLEELRHARLVR